MRETQLADWISSTQWAGWNRQPITGDASARRYERLSNSKGDCVILMDAPVETCGSQKSFVEMATHLLQLGLAAPIILDWETDAGFLVLSDLGTLDFAKHLSFSPNDETLLYGAAVDVLKTLNSTPAPKGLAKMTPAVGVAMIDLAFEWAAKDDSASLREDVEGKLLNLLATVDPEPAALSLRDFHAENLIWRADKSGIGKVGLLDFQDAFVTHPTYDLASLLRDARRDVTPELLDSLLMRLAPEADQNEMRLAFHVMAVQRNLRILGIFQRLAQRDSKTRYLDFVPRVEKHLRTDLAAEGLRTLQPLITRAFLEL